MSVTDSIDRLASGAVPRAIDGRLVPAPPLISNGAPITGGVIVLEDAATVVERKLIAQ
jgi:hypothetical protein